MTPAPLAGLRVLVTRAADQAEGLVTALIGAGAQPVLFPTIEIRPMEDWSALDRALARLTRYTWIGFTSTNAVRIFWERLLYSGQKALPATVRVAAVGRATARALIERGVAVDYVPEEHRGERLADGLGPVRGKSILLPRAVGAREALVVHLRQMGAEVDDVPIYRTVPAQPTAAARAELERGVDVATFTSASTVRQFLALGDSAAAVLNPAVVACIGPLTAEAARGAGLQVAVQSRDYTTDGLVRALLDYYGSAAALPQERIR